jgi:hypothetical protein
LRLLRCLLSAQSGYWAEQEERHNYSGVLHSALLHCRSVLYNVRAFLAVVCWIDGDKMKDFVRVLVDATADPAT